MRLGLIGCGNMGTAILAAVIKSKIVNHDEAFIFDTDIARRIYAVETYQVNVCNSYEELAANSDLIILAVKPQAMESLLLEIRELLKEKAVVSIAAGWTTERYQKYLSDETRFLRVMPNTPALVGFGMTALAAGNTLNANERTFVQRIFSVCGDWVELDEKYFDLITALSGSGPAFIFLMAEAFIAAGVRGGLSYDQARKLTAQTFLGTSAILKTETDDPAIQRLKVTSPGGTTAEGLFVLEDEGVRSAIMKAIQAAQKRSEELSGK